MTSDRVASSSATIHQVKQGRYDVFLSFRGEDTRDNFVSHLHKELCDHQIKTFIDYDLERGDDFPPALLTAIEESFISIIIFSENYADSAWCLKELAKILECRNSINEQIVVPVFYRVDPSCVRYLTGNFGAAFQRLQERLKGKMDFAKLRSRFMEAANISGWDSQVTRPESQLIMGIVGDVLHKLNLISFSYSTNLVGIFHHIEKVESLLCLDTVDVSVVGIWGMGGIGKTTIATAVYNHICERFDASYLLLNIQDELRRQSVNTLSNNLLSKIFEKDFRRMGNQSLGPGFIKRQLQQKKVLIVLDDVNDSIQLKELLGGQSYAFGTGSKILVTSRNRQVLKSITDKIYAVETMNGKDGMALFSLHAFKQNYPTSSYKELSRKVVYYADGNPLALVVLGSALFDRSKEVWFSALEGLEKEPNIDIQNMLRVSYDILSREEKKIFLDIACFLYGSNLDFINRYYGIVGVFRIQTLIDKSLIRVSSVNTIEMHDLLKEMGRSIDREEHSDKLEDNERLWIPDDVFSVLTKNKGTTRIKAILLDMFEIRQMQLDGNAFGGMDSLQFLKFYSNSRNEHQKNKVYLKGCGELEYLPGGLRYFHWDGFPAKHLPSNFCAENLVELRLAGSNVSELWRGVQDLGNLRVISLRKCLDLIKIPDLSKSKNLKRIDLFGCNSCQNVPTIKFVSEALEDIDLSHCLYVRSFPDISSKNIKWLNLCGLDIEEVPSSIEFFSGLEELCMNDCRKLSTISTNICKLTSLTSLSFERCVKLESFPEILEPLENLKFIWLRSCQNLKILPGNWYNLKSLEHLGLSGTGLTEIALIPMHVGHLNWDQDLCSEIEGCKGGTRHPNPNPTSCSSSSSCNMNKSIYVEGIEESQTDMGSSREMPPPPPRVQFIPSSPGVASTNIKYLFLDSCHSLNFSNVTIDILASFSSVKNLSLKGNNWETLPENMDQLSNLKFLDVSDCKRLRSIPKLPLSLKTLEANDCESLESMRMEDGVIRKSKLRTLNLMNCFKLEEVTRRQILTHSQPRMMSLHEGERIYYECVLPGTEIPEWMGMGIGTGSCVTIKLPSWQNVEYNWSQFRGFAFSLLFSPNTTTATTEHDSFFKFQCILKQNDHRVISHLETFSFKFPLVKSENLFMWRWNFKPKDDRGSGELELGELMGKEVSFEFSDITLTAFSTTRGCLAVNKCAVHPLFEGETVPLMDVATATTKANKPTAIKNPSKFRRRRRRLMIRSFSLSLRLSKTRFQRLHSASSKRRIRSFLSLHSSSYKNLKLKRGTT